MLRKLLDRSAPVCPRSLAETGTEIPLVLSDVIAESDGDVESGWLECPAEHGRMEYPIVDGIPLLVPDPAAFLREWADCLLDRPDPEPSLLARFVEAAGGGSTLEAVHRQVGQYAEDHWGEFARTQPGEPSQVAALTERLVPRDARGPESLWLELGCGPGRTVHQLASAGATVVGLDRHLPMVRWGRHLSRRGRATYLRRRSGLLFDPRDVRIDPGSTLRDLWVGDAAAAPFASGSFDGLAAFNLIDCVESPLRVLHEITRLVKPGGLAVLTTPFDWSEAVSEPQHWIGGHSPRAARGGDPAALLRDLLTPGAHPATVTGWRIEHEEDGLPWSVRTHERGRQEYRLFSLRLRRLPDPS